MELGKRPSDQAWFGKSYKQALYYDFKDTLKTLPSLRHIDISHGLSYEHIPYGIQKWVKKREGWWVPGLNEDIKGRPQNYDYKDLEMRAFLEEEDRRKELQKKFEKANSGEKKVSREVKGLLNAFEKPPAKTRDQEQVELEEGVDPEAVSEELYALLRARVKQAGYTSGPGF